MPKKDIFNEDNKVKGLWMEWKNVGDKIQGTYTGKREIFNQLRGENQWVYEIKTEEGEYWNIGGKPAIDDQMRKVKPGQIVGFEFVEERPSVRPGYNAAKIIQIFANSSVVDEEWLKEQEEAKAESTTKNINVEESFNEPSFTDDESKNEKDQPQQKEQPKEEQIVNLAKEKLGVKGKDEAKVKVMEKTGLAFIESNYDEILKKLQES